MNSKQRVLTRERDRGRRDALNLAERSLGMTPTEIIAEDSKVPLFVWGTDYSKCPIGSPIGEIIDGEMQVFTMIVPVNTAHYPGITPNTERSLFSLCRTKDPKRAKPFLPSQGTSGMWMIDECCTKDGRVWQSLQSNHSHPPNEVGTEPFWKDLGTIEEVQG